MVKEKLNACRKLLTVVLFLSATVPVFSQTTALPDNPAGKQAAAYVRAFNTGEEAMRKFFSENVSAEGLASRPVDERVKIYRQMKENMGGLEVRRVLESRDNALVILMQTKNGDWFEFEFNFESAPPHKFSAVRIKDAEPPSGTEPQTSMTQAEMVAVLDQWLDSLVKADEFSGSVLVAKNGRQFFQKAAGLASKEYNAPNRIDTKFNLGSINKVFTKVAIAQLAEQGKLSFDDFLGKHLPDYPNREAAQKVTIQHLLDMTSGIGDFFGEKFDATPKSKFRTVKDFLLMFTDLPLAFEPGSQRQYSNGGYILLGAIIEKISGQSYYDYVREHIYKPAGMASTDHYEEDIPVPNRATGYTKEASPDGSRRSNVYTKPAKGSPAGGGYSTVEDLLKFGSALQEGKLLSPKYTDWILGTLGVAGGAPGINAVLEVNAETGYTVAVMSNYDPPSAERVGQKIRAWLRQVKN